MSNLLEYPGALEALVAAALFGSVLGVIGIPLILKRQAFTGIAISETAALGTAIGALIGLPRYLAPFSFAIGALVLLGSARSRRTGGDGPVAIIYVVAAAAATLLVSKLPTGEADLLVMHFGNILAMSTTELLLGIAVALVCGVVIVTVFRRLLATVNDPVSARALGLKPRLIRAVYAVLLSAAVTYGFVIFGVTLVFAYLIAPAFVALRLSKTLRGWILTSAVVAAASGVMGLFASFALDFPPGPFIAGVLGTFAGVIWLVKR
jgi:ABC-type Mn2+/Zn2+ transport system permease subunit